MRKKIWEKPNTPVNCKECGKVVLKLPGQPKEMDANVQCRCGKVNNIKVGRVHEIEVK